MATNSYQATKLPSYPATKLPPRPRILMPARVLFKRQSMLSGRHVRAHKTPNSAAYHVQSIALTRYAQKEHKENIHLRVVCRARGFALSSVGPIGFGRAHMLPVHHDSGSSRGFTLGP